MSVAQRTAFSKKRGTLVGLCGHCGVNWRPLREAFLPDPRFRNNDAARRLARQGHRGLRAAFADDNQSAMREALDVVLAKRTTLCRPCADVMNKLSPAQLACKERVGAYEARGVRKARQVSQTGVSRKGGWPRGFACRPTTSIQTKVHDLSDYMWWACHGGVEAMRKEAEKCQWMCWCCHLLEKTSSAGRERSGKYPSDERIREKEAYVNARKVAIGTCQYDGCARVVTTESVRSFSLDHKDRRRRRRTRRTRT